MEELPEPVWPAPKAPPKKWTLEDLRQHLQTAVILELHTIPLYLFAMYCIKPKGSVTAKDSAPAEDSAPAKDPAKDPANAIRGVMAEEMLHLALAGNILCATGGQPKLYGPDYTPEYPCKIFFDKTELHLRPPNKEAIASFIRLESPAIVPFDQMKVLLSNYDSIGEFYGCLKHGLKSLHMEMKNTFFNPCTLSRQFGPQDTPHFPEDQMIQIEDLDTAIQALNLIIEQGEGTSGTIQPGAPSHWEIFKGLEGTDIPHHPAREDPKTENFEGNIKKAMLACDAAYSYLLLSIEKFWATTGHRNKLLRNISGLMKNIIKPIAGFLVTQKLDNREHAGPPFNYFPFRSTALAHDDLVAAIQAADVAYPKGVIGSTISAAKGLCNLAELEPKYPEIWDGA